jgi:hypothetical protein
MQLEMAKGVRPERVTAKLNDQDVRVNYQLNERKLRILFGKSVILVKGDSLSIKTSAEGQQ